MKKFLLGIALVLVAGSSFAQKLTLSPSKFTLKAGETQDITVTLEGAQPEAFDAMQAVFALPVGVEAVNMGSKWVPKYVEVIMSSYAAIAPDVVGLFQGATNCTFFEAGHDYYLKNENEENVFWRTSTKNELNVVLMTTQGVPFPAEGHTGNEELFKIRVKATDRCFTGDEFVEINFVTFSTPAKESVTLENDAEAGVITYAIEHVIPESGYSTLVWPVALDFSANTFTAGTGALDGEFMKPQPVTKIAANEPVIIFGEPGTYDIATTKEEVAKVADNVLEGTVDAPLKVSGTNIYALAAKSEGVGFYRVKEGVEIPQYKAYYTSSASADSFLFEETTGISEVVAADQIGEAYTISGVKVNKPNKKGVYIVNGKKVVVK